MVPLLRSLKNIVLQKQKQPESSIFPPNISNNNNNSANFRLYPRMRLYLAFFSQTTG